MFIFLVLNFILYSFADISELFSTNGFFFSVHSVSIVLFHEAIDLPKQLLAVKA